MAEEIIRDYLGGAEKIRHHKVTYYIFGVLESG